MFLLNALLNAVLYNSIVWFTVIITGLMYTVCYVHHQFCCPILVVTDSDLLPVGLCENGSHQIHC